MSTERNGIDPYKGDIEKDWSLAPAYIPIYYTPIFYVPII